MLLFMKLAWRNLFRNKRRTVIAGSAIAVGLAALIYVDALIIGMERNMIQSATESFLGDGQIHREGFRETLEVEKTIAHLDSVVARLEREEIVAHFAVRTQAIGMLSSPANVSTVALIGVEPEREPYLSQFDDALVAGEYFAPDRSREVLIGDKLAELLEVEIGDRVVMTAAQAHTGDLAQEMFRVSGIYHTDVKQMDRSMALVRLDRAQQMLGLEGEAHEIALNLTNVTFGRDENLPFWKEYSRGGNEAAGWLVLLPQLKAVFALTKFSTLILGVILFSVVSLGIINTLFMSLYERMFEFGVIRAVGTRPFGVGRLVMFEAGALAVFSIILGSILGFVISALVAHTGIDYSGIEYSGVTFRHLLYPVLEVKQYLVYPAAVFLFTVLIGLYPATFAAKMNPAEAMRKSM